MDRKGFLRRACIAGACCCGFGAVPLKAANESLPEQNAKSLLGHDWLNNLIRNLDGNLEPQVLRRIIKMSATVHYQHLKMDEVLKGYTGRLKEFAGFLEEEWGWKVDYNEETGIILADEGKDYCVCPVLKHTSEADTSAICYCSEGFAEIMFSKVAGIQVTATVISSVRRGDRSCVYRIEIPAVS